MRTKNKISTNMHIERSRRERKLMDRYIFSATVELKSLDSAVA